MQSNNEICAPLPADVNDHIQSSYRISSICQCVDELLFNAIDSGAVSIAVRINLPKFIIQVVDNGCGMNENDLIQCCNRNFTKKPQDPTSTIGFRGQSLCCIAELCKEMRIVSRLRADKATNRTWEKVVNRAERIEEVNLCSESRACPGTTITLHGVFSCLPVRQAAFLRRYDFELGILKDRITTLALGHPNIAITLRDDDTGKMLFQKQRSRNVEEAFWTLFSSEFPPESASLKFHNRSFRDQEISLVLRCLPYEHFSDRLQFVFVDGRPIFRSKFHDLISKELLEAAARSKNEKISDMEKAETEKTKNQYPVFLFFISTTQRKIVEIFDCYNERTSLIHFKNRHHFENAVKNLCARFFESGKSKKRKKKMEGLQEQTKTKKVLLDSSRSVELETLVPELRMGCTPLSEATTLTFRTPEAIRECVPVSKPPAEKTIFKIPVLKEELKTARKEQEKSAILTEQSPIFTMPRPVKKRLFSYDRIRLEEEVGGKGEDDVSGVLLDSLHAVRLSLNTALENTEMSTDMLDSLKVIGQFDLKFIVCMVNWDGQDKNAGSTLVIFDQHAVHERIRLEQLSKEYGLSGQNVLSSQLLAMPLKIALPASDRERLTRNPTFLARCGIFVDADPVDTSNGAALQLKSVPSVLLAKEAKDVRRSAGSRLTDDVKQVCREISEIIRTTQNVNTLSWFPPAVKNILSSMACKSAIRFGDRLLHEQCQNLITDLRKCEQPFICAHGRPSVVPLVRFLKKKQN